MKYQFKFLGVLLLMLSMSSHATPEGGPVSLVEVRPYINGAVFVKVNSTEFCNTNVFKIARTS